jgi:hypothetical protein
VRRLSARTSCTHALVESTRALEWCFDAASMPRKRSCRRHGNDAFFGRARTRPGTTRIQRRPRQAPRPGGLDHRRRRRHALVTLQQNGGYYHEEATRRTRACPCGIVSLLHVLLCLFRALKSRASAAAAHVPNGWRRGNSCCRPPPQHVLAPRRAE